MIRVEKLQFTYPDGTKALNDISLDVEEGESIIVTGRNGSGKSTLARHLNGLLLPTKGEVSVDGVPTHQDEFQARRKVGLVFQNPDNQIVGDTVIKDIAFGPENLDLSSSEIEERVEEAVRVMDLEGFEDRSPYLLSTGQKKRVAIAGVLAMRPKCLVLDDPLAGLDYPSTSALIQKLAELKDTGYTIIIMSHSLDKVWRLADRLVLLNEGNIVARGRAIELFQKDIERYGIAIPTSWKAIELLLGERDLNQIWDENV